MTIASKRTALKVLALALCASVIATTALILGQSQTPASATTLIALNAGRPAFLDAADKVTRWVDQPTTAGALMNHISVRCGADFVPVTSIVAISGPSAGADNKSMVALAGTLQSAVGGANWTADDVHTQMREVGPNIYEFQAKLPKGHYEYKIVRGGTWAENYGDGFKRGGANISLDVPADDTPVLFHVDFNQHTIQTSVGGAGSLSTAGAPADLPSNVFRLTLGRTLTPADIVRPMSVRFADKTTRPLVARDVLSDRSYFYNGDDLGPSYSMASTQFKVGAQSLHPLSCFFTTQRHHPSTRLCP